LRVCLGRGRRPAFWSVWPLCRAFFSDCRAEGRRHALPRSGLVASERSCDLVASQGWVRIRAVRRLTGPAADNGVVIETAQSARLEIESFLLTRPQTSARHAWESV